MLKKAKKEKESSSLSTSSIQEKPEKRQPTIEKDIYIKIKPRADDKKHIEKQAESDVIESRQNLSLPAGFFDDSKEDAKAHGIDPKQIEKELKQFKREVRETEKKNKKILEEMMEDDAFRQLGDEVIKQDELQNRFDHLQETKDEIRKGNAGKKTLVKLSALSSQIKPYESKKQEESDYEDEDEEEQEEEIEKKEQVHPSPQNTADPLLSLFADWRTKHF
ncbi:uncharacterized protein MONOS_3209 [Monocercomonoides exilis]|uniref:uncharacterized protein n=1 Tax=Monocercomonoides exilis TaxID=2049356 RepID=UPI00355ABBFA|nr:hypothetical protein MONOS_3209 [Monocercomonoides exilis]|eukprot:MONOS_3209.1-p1 / transcript=MONOS_3209.1 / gene=MONOS_3209 / organism=Monocercomonoides_exilis_PA203 / gene_product=unspecified product / transcript_product=unspecified product / location=Mono_scaffold00073:92289-93071(-) / protein_length=220 / sequence_SO=supercontig / SO=protein_coding / is_pseudo=false